MTAPAFTTEVLDWSAWIPPVDLASATPLQGEVLTESGAHAAKSEYYHLLLHDALALRERSKLFKAIMYGANSLSRAARELGATVESILNGCIYCTSVHARFYLQLSKSPEIIEGLFRDGLAAELPPCERAIANFSAKLSATPPKLVRSDLQALRDVGFDDSEIADLAASVSIFAWANRLMLTLGEPKKPDRSSG